MFSHTTTKLSILLSASLFLMVCSGCMSAKSHLKKADNAANEIISEYQQKTLNHTEPFTIEEPADSLRRKLMITQDLPGHISGTASNNLFKTKTPLKITLIDALQIAARNNKSYQKKKEDVFSVALNLDLTRSEYQNSYSALLSSLFSNEGGGSDGTRKIDSEVSGGITRKLQTGATLTSKLGIDLVKLLTMDKTSTFGIFADATVSIPLLRGAGKEIAREALTQAERDVVYAIWDFERFKKTFAVDVANNYFRILETEKQIQNAEANYKSISAARERMQALSDAGRTSQTELDQAAQNELKANNSLVSARQQIEDQLDSFKITLGLPVDAKIELDPSELIKLSNETMQRMAETKSDDNADDLIISALTNRLDLMVVKGSFEDAKRKLNVAEDNLDADMKLKLSGSTRQTSITGGTKTVNSNGETTSSKDNEVSFGDGKYSALLELDLPWDRNKERITFRKSIIGLRQAERSIEDKEDSIKQDIRSDVRKIAELKKTYIIQQQSVTLADRRVESTELFMQAGQAQIRDLLEAQDAQILAQDSLVSAVVSYHIARLVLQKDLGLLSVNEKGLWREND